MVPFGISADAADIPFREITACTAVPGELFSVDYCLWSFASSSISLVMGGV